MIGIEIELHMEENYDIKIINHTTKQEIIIKYSDKMISASAVYNLLAYQNNFVYTSKSNIEDIKDGNQKNYFNEIIIIMNNIVEEINKLNHNEKSDECLGIEDNNEEFTPN